MSSSSPLPSEAPVISGSFVVATSTRLPNETSLDVSAEGAPDLSEAGWDSIDRILLKNILQNIREAVLVVGRNQKILGWNRAAETLTGIRNESLGDLDGLFSQLELGPRPGHVALGDDMGLREAIANQIPLVQQAMLSIDKRTPIPVDIQVVPLNASSGGCIGSLIMIHDASYKVHLQQQIRELMEKTISDPLTGVANRAEFERILEASCKFYRCSQTELSMIICDIDFFKRINDNYGHPVGDDALVTFAGMLQRSIREADFLARFGGEEFVILCNDCDGESAVACAEKIRERLQRTPLSCLGQSTLSASFGVTQFCRDDTPDSFFARADQALLRAKAEGRNRVVRGQRNPIGSTKFICQGRDSDEWLPTGEYLIQQSFSSCSPVEVLAAKLEGFVAEHHALIKSVETGRVVVHTCEEVVGLFRRSNDRRVPLKIDLQFKELRSSSEVSSRFGSETLLQITVGSLRTRDRRQGELKQQAEHILRALCSFLMLQNSTPVQDSADDGRGE